MSNLEVDVFLLTGQWFEIPPWISPADMTLAVDLALKPNYLSSLDPHSLSRKSAPECWPQACSLECVDWTVLQDAFWVLDASSTWGRTHSCEIASLVR